MTEDHARQLEAHIDELERAHEGTDPRLVAALVMIAYHQMVEEQSDPDAAPSLARARVELELRRISVPCPR